MDTPLIFSLLYQINAFIQTTSCITKVFLAEIGSYMYVNGSQGKDNSKMWTILCSVIDSMYRGKWSLLNSPAQVCNCIWHLSVFAGRCWLGCWWRQRVKNWYVTVCLVQYSVSLMYNRHLNEPILSHWLYPSYLVFIQHCTHYIIYRFYITKSGLFFFKILICA